jgi:16S rRNA (guanine(527)-N(7))-methyltransferase RsmG
VTVESASALKDLLRENGLGLESRAAQQMARYLTLLEKWNVRINLTAGTDWPSIGPLFQEAIHASRLFPLEADSLLDIGSGAGFPAIPIRILIPRIRLDLVESRGKKAAFLETVANEVGLEGTSVHNRRLEEYLRDNSRVWDCVTWKGLKLDDGDLSRLRAHAHSKTQFWMFHGRNPAVKNPETVSRHFTLIRTEKCAGQKDWRLSIYLPR